MNGIERSRRWKNLKQRLALKGMGCCGAIWRPRTQTIANIIQQVEEEEEEEEPELEEEGEAHVQVQNHHQNIQQVATNVDAATAASGMNLAMALAAERNYREADNVGPRKKDSGNVKSLMMLIEEMDGGDWKKKKSDVELEAGKLGGNDWMCCVCMERNKGAAFIPCGHTFCRVCSRELWVNRGCCPICNRSILEILDIF